MTWKTDFVSESRQPFSTKYFLEVSPKLTYHTHIPSVKSNTNKTPNLIDNVWTVFNLIYFHYCFI